MKSSNGTSTRSGKQLCKIILKSSINTELMVWTNVDRWMSAQMDAGTNAQTLKCCSGDYVSFTASGIDKTGFSLSETSPGFYMFAETCLLKTLWEKEKFLAMSNFSFFHSVFYPFRELSAIFIKFEIVIYKLFQFRRVQTLSFGRCVKNIRLSVPVVKVPPF